MAEPQFQLTRLTGTRLISLQAARGRAAQLLEHAPISLGVALRDGPHRVAGEGIESLGVGVQRWLLIRYDAPAEWPAMLQAAVRGCAAVCDQSDAYVVFAASGDGVREVLARALPVDLRPNALTPEDVAVTDVGHINVVLWRSEAPGVPCFCLAVGRSYAESFEHTVRAGA